ncbi:MAG: Smg family protein [Sulfuriferula sp.]
MFDILIFLFENYPQIELAPDRDALTIKLHAAGFNVSEIDQALDWFSDLGSLNSTQYPASLADHHAIRVYAPYELERIDAQSRGFLLFLEHAGVLNPLQREWIIDRVLALDEQEASLEKIKWIALIVLWSQNPNQDYLLLEDMLFNNGTALAIH